MILKPVLELMTFLEGDKTPASFVNPSVQECKERLQDIISFNDEILLNFAKALIAQLDERLNSQYSILSYA